MSDLQLISAAEDQAAFDKLPARIQAVLREADAEVDSVSVLKAYLRAEVRAGPSAAIPFIEAQLRRWLGTPAAYCAGATHPHLPRPASRLEAPRG